MDKSELHDLAADEGQALWLSLRHKHPRAAQLALLCCLPVRVTPTLLRQARLHLLALHTHATSVGDEADLFLSDLVETRALAGFAFWPELRRFLRQRLSAQPTLLDQVWQRVHLPHAPWLTPRARQEEELCWRLLRDPADLAIEALWARVLGELRSGADGAARKGIARWVQRVWSELPPGSEQHESGRLVHLAAHLMLGDAAVLGERPQRFADSQQLAFATRALPRRTIYVGRTAEGLVIQSQQGFEHGQALVLPQTRPLWLQLEGPGESPQVLTWQDEAVIEWPLARSNTGDASHARDATVRLRLIDGTLYALGPPPVEPMAAQPERPARLRLNCRVGQEGDAPGEELPFVIGVLADLGHNEATQVALRNRRFLDIDAENFDACMRTLRPRLALRVKNQLGLATELPLRLEFASLADFEPVNFLLQIEPCRLVFSALQGWRRLLAIVQDHPHAPLLGLEKLLKDDAFFKTGRNWVENEPLGAAKPRSGAAWLIAKKYRGTSLRQVLIASLGALVEAQILEFGQALMAILAGDGVLRILHARSLQESIAERVALLDHKLSAQLGLILQQPGFQALEGSWRGLHHLVMQCAGEPSLKLRCMHLSKRELAQALQAPSSSQASATPPAHWLQQVLVAQPFSQSGGEPLGLLLGDYSFSHAKQDVALLTALARSCAEAQTVFLAAADPRLLKQERWAGLGLVKGLASQQEGDPEFAAWRVLRGAEDSRYVALTCPRVLARVPYGGEASTAWPFALPERAALPPSEDWDRAYCWANAAYLLAANIGRAFKRDGHLTQLRGMQGGGLVGGLPNHLGNSTDFPLSDRMEALLSRQGLLPLVQRRGGGEAVFFSTQMLMSARRGQAVRSAPTDLADVLMLARFAHGLRCLARDVVRDERDGGLFEAKHLQRLCSDWLGGFVDLGGGTFSLPPGPERPLLKASIAVAEVPNVAGEYPAELYLTPYRRGSGEGSGPSGSETLALRFTLPSGAI